MLSLRNKSGHDEIVSASEIQTIAMAHASSLGAHKVLTHPPLLCNDYLSMFGGQSSIPNQPPPQRRKCGKVIAEDISLLELGI
jgi:hypothetical protein